MTLGDTILALRKTADEDQLMFGYLNVLADHMSLVANVAVRNVSENML